MNLAVVAAAATTASCPSVCLSAFVQQEQQIVLRILKNSNEYFEPISERNETKLSIQANIMIFHKATVPASWVVSSTNDACPQKQHIALDPPMTGGPLLML